MTSTRRVVYHTRLRMVAGFMMFCGACNGGLDTAAVLGTYQARTANGQTLPTPLVVGGTNRLLGGTLELVSPDSLRLILQKDDRPDTLAAVFHLSANELFLTQTHGSPVELVNRASIPSEGSVVVTVIYHFAPGSAFPSDWPVQIAFFR